MLTLGIDVSTQGVKALIYDVEARQVVSEARVNYGRDLPKYGAPDGFLPNDDSRVRRADPRMWAEALELTLRRLQEAGAPLGDVAAVGGDAQQHATVLLTRRGVETMKGGAWKGLPTAEWFARAESPIWMDSSTEAEVARLESRFGAALRQRTGSPATARFAAAQIMKFARENAPGFDKTARVHLLSSFLTSYLAGADAQVDIGDGAGMNLMDLQRLDWDEEICEYVTPGLLVKLPGIVRPGESRALRLAPRYAAFGLRVGIPVSPFTGDNPASLIGCGAAEPGCAVASFGTSDTFFAAMKAFKTDPEGSGNVFGNPFGGFMSLTCFQNGSLARDRVRRELGADWKFFDEMAFSATPPGNGGRRAYPFFEAEISPRHAATGIEANFDWAKASAEVKIRAIVEGQMQNMREQTRWIGEFSVVYATGGAARSAGLRSALAAAFGARVEKLEIADSAALGGALLAAREAS